MKSEKLKIKNIKVKDRAVLIADVHYKKGDKDFLDLLQNWIDNPPPQVFFLGDIFHLLLPFEFLIEYNKEAIELINNLSLKTEIFYTPGNHDFLIDNLFKNVVFADIFVDLSKKIFLSHGDIMDNSLSYKIYRGVIRNHIILNFLHFLSFNCLNNWLFKKLLKKSISCKKIEKFTELIENRLKLDYNLIIEGHYHQGVKIKNYYNMPAFVCNKKYILLKFDNNDFIIKEFEYDR